MRLSDGHLVLIPHRVVQRQEKRNDNSPLVRSFIVLIKLWFCKIIWRMVWSSPCTKLAIFSISIVVRLFPSPFSATIDDTKLWSFKNSQQEFLFAKITNNIREKLKISLSFGWFSFWSEFLNFSSSVLHSATVCLVKSTNWSHSRAFYQLWMVILLIFTV